MKYVISPLAPLVLALVLVVRPAVGQAMEAEPEIALTLHQALEMAMKSNENIAIDRESVTAAGASLREARGAYDPRLELRGGWVESSQPVNSLFSGAPAGLVASTSKSAEGTVAVRQLLPSGGELSLAARAARETTDGSAALLTPSYGTQVGISLRQPILRGRASDPARLAVRVARAETRESEAALRRTTTEMLAEVERAYWSLAAVRLGTEVLEENVELAREQFAQTDARVQSGEAPETELAQPRAELERRTGDLLASREDVARAENRLKLLILSDDDPQWMAPIVPVDPAEVEIDTLDVAGLMEQALAARPELAADQARLERRRAEVADAADAVWPSLDAVLTYDRYGLAGDPNPLDPDATTPGGLDGRFGASLRSLGDGNYDAARFALVLGFPIGNRVARGAVVSARSAQRQARADLARSRKRIRAEVLDAVAALETAGQRIAAGRAAREAAEVQLGAEQDRYRAGLSTNFLVLTRQNDLSRARLEEISALTDYRMAQAELSRATGSLAAEQGLDQFSTRDSNRVR